MQVSADRAALARMLGAADLLDERDRGGGVARDARSAFTGYLVLTSTARYIASFERLPDAGVEDAADAAS